MKLRVIARLIEIQRVLVRHGLDEFVRATHLYRPLRFLFLLSPWTWAVRRREAPRAERLREALQELGPIFVKFGQALSTRRDLLPLDIAEELAKLQDRVPPFDGRIARRIIEDAYGRAAEQVFSTFDETAAGGRLDRAGACRRAAAEVGSTARRRAKSWSRCCGPACTR